MDCPIRLSVCLRHQEVPGTNREAYVHGERQGVSIQAVQASLVPVCHLCVPGRYLS